MEKKEKLTIELAWLTDILSVQSYYGDDGDMQDFLLEEVSTIAGASDKGLFITYDAFGNMYVVKGMPKKGEFYPCVVAHIDTVQAIVPTQKVFHEKGVLFAMDMEKVEQIGIGGDDKVGIYLALEMLSRLDACKVVFFREEESGCLGSMKADMTFFSDCAFVLQADRRGSKDFIHNSNSVQLYSKVFLKNVRPILDEYGFKEEIGSITDVGQLKENGLKISCANVSCGYYYAHTNQEYVYTLFVERTLNLFYDICTTLCFKQWKHNLVRKDYDDWTTGYYTEYRNGIATRVPIHNNDDWKGTMPRPDYNSTLTETERAYIQKYKLNKPPLVTTGHGTPVNINDVAGLTVAEDGTLSITRVPVEEETPVRDFGNRKRYMEDEKTGWLWEKKDSKYVSSYANAHVLKICSVCNCSAIEIDNSDSGYLCMMCDAHYDWAAADSLAVPDEYEDDGVASDDDKDDADRYMEYLKDKWDEMANRMNAEN